MKNQLKTKEIYEILELAEDLPPRPWGYRFRKNGDAFITDRNGKEIMFTDKTAQFVVACINNFEALTDEYLYPTL